MKILTLSPYISENNEHKKNQTGFGMMVLDIVNSLCGQGNEVYVLTHALCRRQNDGPRVIMKHTLSGVLLHTRIRGLGGRIVKLCRLPCPLTTKLRLLYYYLDRGFVMDAIKKTRPDIVHIHGLGVGSANYIEACEELNVPFVITAHGLLQNDPGASMENREFERELLRSSGKKGIQVTVVSTGVRNRLTGDYYGLVSTGNIHVVTNGTAMRIMEKTADIRARYGISDNCKICLAVGSVCEKKNQLQLIRAFFALPDYLRENTHLLLLGNISEGYPIKKVISELGLEAYVICCGFIQHEELPSYYAATDLNILASVDEGFGLSIIEGFVYGVPCVTFSDLDAVPDIYDKNAVELCFDRTDGSLTKAISAALERQWDKDAIKRHGEKFSLKAMAEQYINVYAQAIDSHNK